MIIDFKTLRSLTASINKGDERPLIEYLNSFEGNNIYDKFINILNAWSIDVSFGLNLNLDNKQVKIPLTYIISEFTPKENTELSIISENFKILVDIPKKFDNLVQDTIPIYSVIKYVQISDKSINLTDLSIQDKMFILDNLPAKVYNDVLLAITKDTNSLVRFENILMSKIRFNFLTNEPYMFLKGLFSNFNDDYFRDVIYLLSKKIDGNILMNSTPLEIEYYIEKYTHEMETQNSGLQI